MQANEELLEKLERRGESIEDIESDPSMQFQLQALQASRDAREAGASFLALEHRLMVILYGLYTLAIESGELEDERIATAEGELDPASMHLLDVVASSRRALLSGVDEETVRKTLETAMEIATDSDALEGFYQE